ncbi:hypothetical protein [Pseudochrobactrum asaccharolyticum]|uniref:hypothetical protein n=1 Tax=Pseudochrobactrum asaccharolyticum TaxID=354351 RepID=UPI0014734259|nr:hypothetical protein [Pseudochrobactrum asaccharolyticum]
MSAKGFVLGAIIGIGVGAALITSSPKTPIIGITTAIAFTILFGLLFSKIDKKYK